MADKNYLPHAASLEDWQAQAKKQTKGKGAESLIKGTPEGIDIQPLYTQADVAQNSFTNTLPGFEPYIREPQATMYAGRPWTIRQYGLFNR